MPLTDLESLSDRVDEQASKDLDCVLLENECLLSKEEKLGLYIYIYIYKHDRLGHRVRCWNKGPHTCPNKGLCANR